MKLVQFDENTGDILRVVSAPGAGEDLKALYPGSIELAPSEIVSDLTHRVDLDTLTVVEVT